MIFTCNETIDVIYYEAIITMNEVELVNTKL